MPGDSAPSQKPMFFHFVDAQGQDHVVNRWEDVPAAQRSTVRVLDGNAPQESVASTVAPTQAWPWGAIHVPSFVAGAAVMLVGTLLWGALRGGGLGRWFLKLAVMGVLFTALTAGALMVLQNRVRMAAGLPASWSPTQVVDDARAVREQLKGAVQQQEETLKHIE